MDYRLSSNFTQRLPWKSSWSTHTNIPEIEEVLKKGFPEALPYATILLSSTSKVHQLKRGEIYPSAVGKLVAIRKFSKSGYTSLAGLELDNLAGKIRQHMFLDIALWLIDDTSPPSPEYFPTPSINVSETFSELSKGFKAVESRLLDWKSIITTAKEQFGATNQTMGDFVPQSSHPSMERRLFEAIHAFSSVDFGKIMGNMCCMIFTVGYMLSGKLELPAHMIDLQGALNFSGSSFPSNLLMTSSSKLQPHHLRKSLQVALCISPLAALIPVSMEKRLFSDLSACKLWMALGNKKPPTLVAVERKMWQFIFKYATVNEPILPPLTTLLNELEILAKAASPEDLAWFTAENITSRRTRALKAPAPVPMDLDNEDGDTQMAGVDDDDDHDADGEPEIDSGEEGAAQDEVVTAKKVGMDVEGEDDEEEKDEDDDEEEKDEDDDEEKKDEDDDEEEKDKDDDEEEKDEDDDEEEKDEEEGKGKDGEGDVDMEGENTTRPKRAAARKKALPVATRPLKRKRPARSKVAIVAGDDDEEEEEQRTSINMVKRMQMLYREFVERGKSDLLTMEAHAGAKLDVRGETMNIPIPTVEGPQRFYAFDPVFHHQSQLKLVKGLYEVFKPNLNVSLNDPSSPFCVMSWGEYQAASPGFILDLFRTKNVIIVGRPLEKSVGISGPVLFDEVGLGYLGPLSRSVILHDLSKPVKGQKELEVVHVSGKLGDLLKAKEEGRSVNLLDCPFYTDYGKPQVWDLPYTAWEHLSSQAVFKSLGDFPMSVSRWGLAATKGCTHTWHVDSSGFLAFFTLLTGVKIFLIGVPKPGHDLSSTFAFKDFSIDGVNRSKIDIWMVALEPGMQYIQTANQLHYVITPEDSIVLGGHSFVTPALQQSAVSIYHQFVAGYDITNNENMKEAFLLLSAIVAFFHEKLVVNQVEFDPHDKELCHLPQLDKREGILDLLALAHLMELGNVLCHWGYEPSVQGAPDRFVMISMRKMARELLVVAFGTYELVGQGGDSLSGWQGLFQQGLVNICVALTLLKRQHEKKNGVGDPLITAEAVESAIIRALFLEQPFTEIYLERIQKKEKSASFANVNVDFTVRRRLEAGMMFSISKAVKPIDGFTFDDLNTGILGVIKEQAAYLERVRK